jgi:hypothetical protein
MYVDKELSRRIARRKEAKGQDVYHAAYCALLGCSELSIGRYVEGYAVAMGGTPFEHGWIELGGKIVDPAAFESGLTYFPGLRLDRWEAWEALTTIPRPEYVREELPIFYRFGWGGCDSPEMMQAYAEALAFSAANRQSQMTCTMLDGDGDGTGR